MEKLNSCPVCGSNQSQFLFDCKDYVASGEDFSIQQCLSCSLKYTNPRPAESEIGPYYQSDRYVSHSGQNKSRLGFTYKLYDWIRFITIRQKLAVIRRFHSNGRLLDLGCGLGYFLNGVLNSRRYDAVGADVSEDAIRFVKTAFGLDVLPESELEKLEDGAFTIITQWHVMEHVHRLPERMIQLKRLLQPDGTMFIAVPISVSFDAGFYGRFWDGYDVPRHLYHFTPDSFVRLMENSGFRVVEQRAMWFDAPYVSMRSEYHQKHALGFLRGAFWGIVSNLLAIFTRKHSSIMFVVKHA